MITRAKRGISCIVLAVTLIAAAYMIAGSYIQPQAVFAASNTSKFYWAYMGSGVDGRSNQMFHKLGKGTAQIKVEKCGGYTSRKQATVTLRKSKNKYPFYTNCGTVKFYKKGTYSFGSVSKNSYWLYVSGSGEAKKNKYASGKVQNK